MLFCAGLIVVYFMHCVFVYWYMEEDWSLTVAAYYSFSTFSTIGLGDYVPLSKRRQRNVWKHLTWYHLWHLLAVVLGMALISVLFTLIAEGMTISARRLEHVLEAREPRGRPEAPRVTVSLSFGSTHILGREIILKSRSRSVP